MNTPLFGGLHVGLSGLYGVVLQESGTVLARSNQRFRSAEELGAAYERAAEELRAQLPGFDPPLWTLALEKPQRLVLAPRTREARLSLTPQVVQPALSAVLLGSIPTTPGLLISLGQEVRLAAIDSTLGYREFRFQEGGGTWWQREIRRLSEYSQRLKVHLQAYPDHHPPLPQLGRLLEMGRYPTPDPVLKPRLDKIAQRLAEMALTLTLRRPGISNYAFSGFLAESALAQSIGERLEDLAPQLRRQRPRFPPEVGAALTALALFKENAERRHLAKATFAQARSLDDWQPPQVLLRRLFRLRKPFAEYAT